MTAISNWWSTLSPELQIFWGIALIASFLFVFQFIMSMIGIDADTDIEGDASWDHDSVGFNLISIRGILAGLMMFGWTGIALLNAGQNVIIASAGSLLTGILAMVGVAYFMRFFLTLQDSGQDFDLHNALHEIGEVYLIIPPAKSGRGKIHITFSNMYQELDAITSSNTAIPTGSKVMVVEVTPDKLLRVEKI